MNILVSVGNKLKLVHWTSERFVVITKLATVIYDWILRIILKHFCRLRDKYYIVYDSTESVCLDLECMFLIVILRWIFYYSKSLPNFACTLIIHLFRLHKSYTVWQNLTQCIVFNTYKHRVLLMAYQISDSPNSLHTAASASKSSENLFNFRFKKLFWYIHTLIHQLYSILEQLNHPFF